MQCIFDKSGTLGENEFFSSFLESVYSLLILQSTVDFPDIMMASYDVNQYTAIFFLVYNAVGIYFLMALVLAVIYSNYNRNILHTVRSTKRTRDNAMREAGQETQSKSDPHNDKKRGQWERVQAIEHGDWWYFMGHFDDAAADASEFDVESSEYKPVIYYHAFHKILVAMRPDLASKVSHEFVRYMYLAICDAKISTYDDGIDEEHWCANIDLFLDMQVHKDVSQQGKLSVLEAKNTLMKAKTTFRELIPDVKDGQEKDKDKDKDKDKESQTNKVIDKNLPRLLVLNNVGLDAMQIANQDTPTTNEDVAKETQSDVVYHTQHDTESTNNTVANKRWLDESETELLKLTFLDEELPAWCCCCFGRETECLELRHEIAERWLNFRLRLIAFWEWKKEYTLCGNRPGEEHESSVWNSRRSNALPESTTDNDQHSEGYCHSFVLSTDLLINVLVMLSTSLVIVEVYLPNDQYLEILSLLFVWIFILEVVCKIMAWGWDGYFQEDFNKLDCVISVTTFFMEAFLGRAGKYVLVFRLIRLLRLMRAFTRFRVILKTTTAVVSSFTALFLLEFCLSYILAIIGMELYTYYVRVHVLYQLFEGKVTQENVKISCEEADDKDPLTVEFWCFIYSSYYYNNNFNSLWKAMVVIMEVMAVANWQIIAQMFVLRTSKFARVYFILVYYGTVVVVMNVLTAFVLQAFISQYEKSLRVSKQLAKAKLYRSTAEYLDGLAESEMQEREISVQKSVREKKKTTTKNIATSYIFIFIPRT
ncbi:two-pore calcium channel 3 [Reticulomyxa filosa]|uniref:Two-pore calcium channel 3 n=1 Tax=Reticulomyxa filosa TaxID=46433 RepID=X6NBZ8_RETFI|nr:two-pore calcium channel 3 [Reticulomyxa filosa]|eukprot:ETO23388.1 two-pore calcium channel 3 [Reticulomyxa filosa]